MDEIKLLNEQEVLGKRFRVYGTTEMISTVDDDEKVKIHTTVNNVSGGSDTWFLTEDGLYEVLMKSRKPIAKKFKKKVKEILKTLRKTGGYISNTDKFIEMYFDDIPEDQKSLVRTCLSACPPAY